MFKPQLGAYPTMITPYNADGSVDYGAAKALTRWYWEHDCDGIFAVCQSSEIHKLTLEERVKLAAVVAETARECADGSRPRMTVVASGHISDGFEEQVTELREIASAGIDSLILISNRLDIPNTDDEHWIAELDRLIERLPDIPLGVYECPCPYKRLLTPAMLEHITRTGRFAFIKDTCCDPVEIDRRVRQIAETPSPALKPYLFNANSQTVLETLRSGGAGFCGIMGNFHPELFAYLCKNWKTDPNAELLAAFLCQCSFIDSLHYPCIAKYHLDKQGVTMTPLSRVCDASAMTDYEKLCVDRMDLLAEYVWGRIVARH